MAHMDVLLKEDVENLGQRGQVVRVRAGYGRNYLLPQNLAIEASAGNRRMIEEQQRVLAKREQREKVTAQGEAQKLDGLELRFDRRVGEHGLLYGSVTALDVAEELKRLGYNVERGHRAVQNSVLADAPREAQLQAVEFTGLSLRAALLALLALGQHALLLFDHAAIAGARLDGQLLRQQVIAPVAGAHAHDLAALAEVLYVFL